MTESLQNPLQYASNNLDDATDNDVDHQLNRTFQHPWIDSKSQIRLLRPALSTGAHSSASYEATLEICGISDLPNTEYVALSYCWGEARSVEDVQWITVDNRPFAVRTNLANYLNSRSVSDPGPPLYVDAVCLNQRDRDERGNQVGLMSNVYRNASRTVVWLGLCPVEQEKNLESLRNQLAVSRLGHGLWHTASLVGLSFLCSRVYWRRLWVVQELLLSTCVDIRCGNFTFNLTAIVRLLSPPNSQRSLMETPDTGWWDSWQIAKPRDYSVQSAQEGEIRDGWQWAVRLLHNRAKWLARNANDVDAAHYPSGLPFHEALTAFRHQQCRDRRDKVYALLGLLDKEGRQMMKSDYHCTTHALFTQAVAACLVSRWKSTGTPTGMASHDYQDRRYCDILSSMLALDGLDVEHELSRAMEVARSYVMETDDLRTPLTTEHSQQLDSEAEIDVQPLPQPIRSPASEIQVGNGQYLFGQVFLLFKDELSSAEMTEYALCERKALELSLATIQKKQRAMGAMRDMSRLRGFLQAISAYETLANSCLNVQNAVAYIWASAKFLMEATHTSPDAFTGLLKAYQNLGESVPAASHVETLSENELEQHDVVALIFHGLFGFHRLALHYFKKPAWKQLLTATWDSLEAQLGAFAATLREYKVLIQGRAQDLALDESRRQRAQTNTQLAQLLAETRRAKLRAEEAFKQLSEEEVIRRRTHVVNWLSASDSWSDQDHGRSVRQRCPQSGTWLLQESRYCRWNDVQAEDVPLLWINAIPGAGKSVLASLVVDECLQLTDATTIFFYFKQDNPEKNTFLAMTRCLLHQLSQCDDTLLLYLFEIATRRGENVLQTTKLAKEVLMTCLNATGRVRAVLDGIDECHQKEQKHIADFFIKHVEDSSSGPNSCRCVIFSQDDASTRPLFASLPAIRISGESHKADIRKSCVSWGEMIQSKFSLSWQETQWIVTETANRAQSMFLFAHVVMDNLYEQVTQADLFAELHSFPAELNDAYARVVARVLEHAKPPLRRNAQRLLSWVACAIRPLKWREIQVAVSINKGVRALDLDNNRFRVSLKQLCGALLDERPNGDIEFVHHSAEEYLINQHHVDLGLEHCKLTELCLDYFALPAFSVQCAESELYHYAEAGIYGFMDYAIAAWVSHLEHAVHETGGSGLPGALIQALETFFAQHWRNPRKRTKPTKRITELCGKISNISVCGQVKQTMSAMHCLMATNLTDMQAVETLDLFEGLIRIRAALEALSAHSSMEQHYGPKLFKCPRIYCRWFHEGFSRVEARKLHLDKHERSHLCPHLACVHAAIGFATAGELFRHVDTQHEKLVTEEVFPNEQDDVPGASRSQEEELRSDPQPAKLTPDEEQSNEPEATNSAPGPSEHPRGPQAAAEKHKQPRETQSNHERARQRPPRKKPARSMQCPTCSRVFTRSSNLRSHIRTHSDVRPFSCPICGNGFKREHDRDRHEALHGKDKFIFKEQKGYGRRS